MAKNFTDSAPEVAPQVGGSVLQSKLPHPPREAFYYRFHPLRWMFIEATGEWLPQLAERVLSPGVGGVDKDGDPTSGQVHDQKRHWIGLRADLVPPGTTGGSYIKALACKSGIYHCSRWEYPQHVGDKVLPSTVDIEGYHDWLRWLVAEGHVPAPLDGAKAIAVEAQRQRYRELEGRRGAHPHLNGAAKQTASRIKAMEASIGGEE